MKELVQCRLSRSVIKCESQLSVRNVISRMEITQRVNKTTKLLLFYAIWIIKRHELHLYNSIYLQDIHFFRQ